MLDEQENSQGPLSPERALEGTILDGRYRLDERFDEGGVGAVWRATQLAVGRTVVVKLLHEHLRASAESIGRFELEARALASMRHPGCVTLFDFGWSEELGAHYMVMEEVEGEPLSRALRRGMPTVDALEACAVACEALAHAHDRGVLHRDLKPSNIMLLAEANPRAKILDFGLARLFDQEALLPRSEPLSMAGRVYGTPAYMSPEQCEGAPDLGPECDVYALGVILFEILEGELPFPEHSAVGTLIAHVQRDVPRPSNDLVSDDLKDLVVAMTARDRRARLSELDLIRAALEDEVARMRAGSSARLSAESSAMSAEPSDLGAETTIPDAPPEASIARAAGPGSSSSESPTIVFAPPLFAIPSPQASSPKRALLSWSRPARLIAAVSLIALAAGALAFHSPWSDPQSGEALRVTKIVYEPTERSTPPVMLASIEPAPEPRTLESDRRADSEDRRTRTAPFRAKVIPLNVRTARRAIAARKRARTSGPQPVTGRPPTIKLSF